MYVNQWIVILSLIKLDCGTCLITTIKSLCIELLCFYSMFIVKVISLFNGTCSKLIIGYDQVGLVLNECVHKCFLSFLTFFFQLLTLL